MDEVVATYNFVLQRTGDPKQAEAAARQALANQMLFGPKQAEARATSPILGRDATEYGLPLRERLKAQVTDAAKSAGMTAMAMPIGPGPRFPQTAGILAQQNARRQAVPEADVSIRQMPRNSQQLFGPEMSAPKQPAARSAADQVALWNQQRPLGQPSVQQPAAAARTGPDWQTRQMINAWESQRPLGQAPQAGNPAAMIDPRRYSSRQGVLDFAPAPKTPPKGDNSGGPLFEAPPVKDPGPSKNPFGSKQRMVLAELYDKAKGKITASKAKQHPSLGGIDSKKLQDTINKMKNLKVEFPDLTMKQIVKVKNTRFAVPAAGLFGAATSGQSED